VNRVRKHSRGTAVIVGWADDHSSISVVCPPALQARLSMVWPPESLRRATCPSVASTTSTVRISGYGDAISVVVDGTEAPGGWCRVESTLALFAAEHLVGRVAVHAGLVVHNGVGIMIPGSSFAGKSTLCAALSDVGAEVRCDEYVLIDPATGLVSGWARPLRRRRADGGVDRIEVSAERTPVRVGLIAALRYAPTAGSGWSVLETTDAILSILANTVSAQRDPHAALTAALVVARTAEAIGGERGPARDAAVRILRHDAFRSAVSTHERPGSEPGRIAS